MKNDTQQQAAQEPVKDTGASVETPTNTNQEPANGQVKEQAPDMHGFTSDQLADMRKFFDNNGGFDGVKARISNPEKPAEQPAQPAEKPAEPQGPTSPQPAQPVKTPEGSITREEWMAKEYFKSLSQEEKYAPIAKEIASGELLNEMASFNIQPLNQDGSINDRMVRRYLNLKAQTVPAQPTGIEPNMSNAPTVDYVAVGDKIESDEQAYQVLMQAGHPRREDAKAYIKSKLNPNQPAPGQPNK